MVGLVGWWLACVVSVLVLVGVVFVFAVLMGCVNCFGVRSVFVDFDVRWYVYLIVL